MYRPVMRILAVANHLGSRGGLERTQLANCRGLATRGHQVDVVFQSAGDFADQWREFAGALIEVGATLPLKRRPLWSVLSVASAVAKGVGRRPDVVYVYRYWDLPYAAAVAALCRAKVVYHLCLPPPRRVPWWLRIAIGSVDRTLSVSRDTADRWAGTGLRRSKVTVVLTAVDLDHYRPADASARSATRAGLGLHEDDFVVLYAGRIDRAKGVDVLLEAFGQVAKSVAHCHLLVVGSPSLGSDPEDSRRFTQELTSLADRLPVTFLSGRSDVVDLVQAVDVAVVPSLWPEPLPRSVMEPLACGTPVVATRVGGIPEILEGWLSEYLVAPSDVEGLSDRLVSLASWRQSDPDLGSRLRAAAESRLSLDQEVDVIEATMKDSLLSAQRERKRGARARSDAKS